ncbi:hypothetical protein N0V90_003797 [Kalmusia sp. IMI 367209]|nr:hypothetical protein N0V90_003797 [Kalmusia sp. IMI 367209]
MRASPASIELEGVRRFVKGRGLEFALNNLPLAIDLSITPQTDLPSEHPFKLLIGTQSNQKVWIGLGTTPKHGHGPKVDIYFNNGGLTRRQFNFLNEVDMVEPFKRLWENTSICTQVERGWMDLRRGMLKSLTYWYLLIEVNRVGGMLLVPLPIRKYFVEALKRLGVEPYTIAGCEIHGSISDRSPHSPITQVEQCTELRRLGTELEKTEHFRPNQERNTLQKKRNELKRQLHGFNSTEEELDSRHTTAKQARTHGPDTPTNAISDLGTLDEHSHQRRDRLFPSHEPPSSQTPVNESLRATVGDLPESANQSVQSFVRSVEQYTNNGHRATASTILTDFQRPVQQRSLAGKSLNQLAPYQQAASKTDISLENEQNMSTMISDKEQDAEEASPRTFIVKPKMSAPTIPKSVQGHNQPSLPHTGKFSNTVTQVDDFRDLKQMMDVEAALRLELQFYTSKAESVKLKLEKQRVAIQKKMAEVVAKGSK